MKRRTFVKLMPFVAVAPAALQALFAKVAFAKSAGKGAATAGQKREVPAYAGKLQHSDGAVADADGNTKRGFNHTSSKAQRADAKAPYQMPLTKEEQDIMDGKKGPELAKVMAIVVAHGNAFGAPKLVKLGGAPHCSLYTGTD